MIPDIDAYWLWFWTAMIFASIAWYAILLVWVGWRGGRDVVEMTRALLKNRPDDET
ncbi:MAG: hypothetical protein JW809_12820 [Pirellulales bacterium]|nr:hypothetical protein [Pirellulales bacterium]